jgi:hypothetical protein
MFSILRKGLVYKNISQDIVEHDLDIDVDQWCYDQKDVYRGSIDPDYVSHKLNVYWLYDDYSRRVGLAEHDAEDPAVFKALWFYDNPYATLFQDTMWNCTNETLWSKISTEAYQDLLEDDFKNVSDVCLNSGRLLITPKMLIESPDIFECELCGKKSLTKPKSCSVVSTSSLDFSQFSVFFLDDDFVIYSKPSSEAQQQPDACEPVQPAQQVPSADLEELKADLLEYQEPDSQSASQEEAPPHLPLQ